MSQSPRVPLLADFYLRYLEDKDRERFIRSTGRRYKVGTLLRITEMSDVMSRRAALVAIGFLGDFRCNGVVGKALLDNDRGVRTLAEETIKELWVRDGSAQQRRRLQTIIKLNEEAEFKEAQQLSTELGREVPWFAEIWNQRAIARYHLAYFDQAAADCHQALELNPYHYPAAVGMGHCYMEMDNGAAALECFERALKLHPDLERVRAHVKFLQRKLNDSEERSE
jgi:tetratricopeptide (TPR) repeat protein